MKSFEDFKEMISVGGDLGGYLLWDNIKDLGSQINRGQLLCAGQHKMQTFHSIFHVISFFPVISACIGIGF